MKKLYVVEVTHRAYVWAEDEDNAEAFADEIVRTEQSSVEAYPVESGSNPLAWNRKSLVYHDETRDIELGEVLDTHPLISPFQLPLDHPDHPYQRMMR